MHLTVKRVYEKPAREDGKRVLVDRLWPRGLTKEAAAIDVWLRDLAPSNELRKWYHENAGAWAQFRTRYARELKRPEAAPALQQLAEWRSRKERVTLLFASKDLEHNNAVALQQFVEQARKSPASAKRGGTIRQRSAKGQGTARASRSGARRKAFFMA